MRRYDTVAQFYGGPEWEACKMQVLHARMTADGAIYCEHCGRLILKGFNPQAKNNAGAIVFHHKVYLNNLNVNDASVSINPDNIAVLHWSCHNEVHERFGYGAGNRAPEKKVYLITGAPCSGKTSFVRERVAERDIVLDIDDLWQTISGQPRYTKPNAIKPIVFAVRDEIKGLVARGAGTWRNAYIIEALPAKLDRMREADRYRAHNIEIITMQTERAECLARLHANPNGRNVGDYEQYIAQYFARWSE